MKYIKTFEQFLNEKLDESVDMTELQRELKELKAKHPKAKVSYSFIKDGKKGYVFHIKEELEESNLNEELRDDELKHLAKELAHSMPNHTKYEGVPTDSQIRNAFKYVKDIKHATSSQKNEIVKIVKEILTDKK